MTSILEKHLGVYPGERADFIRSALLFAFVFFFFAIFRNYVDASFIKRIGPDRIPLMLCLSGALTMAFFHLCRRLGGRISDRAALVWFFACSALLQTCLFWLVRAGSSAAQPMLFQLLYLQDAFLLVYLWNLVQGIFDARQGKRLFKLLMAAQVLGGTMGSLAGAPLAAAFGQDATLAICAGANLCFAALLSQGPRAGTREEKAPANAVPVTLEALAAFRRYPIFRFLCVCAVIPNLALPILTYQFGVVTHDAFAGEMALLEFLGWFRSAVTASVFVGIFLLGRLLDRISSRDMALASPINQCLAFGALGMFFNLKTAAYAQFSNIFLQRIALGPLTKQLFSLLPGEIASWSQVFARGTLVQASTLCGALGILALKQEFAARDLSVAAILLSLVWTAETLRFRKRYKTGLKQVLAERRLDFDLTLARPVEKAATLTPEDYPEHMLDLMAELDISDLPPEAALAALDSPDPEERAKAAGSFALNRAPDAVLHLIRLLDDTENVRRAAVEALSRYGPDSVPALEQALDKASTRAQRGILEVLRLAEVRDADITPLLGRLLTRVYNSLIAARALEGNASGTAVSMLATHLREQRHEDLFTAFLALWVTHEDMRLIFEAVNSRDASAASEMLEASLDHLTASRIVPLVDTLPEEEIINRGRQVLPLIRGDTPARALYALSAAREPVTRLLAMAAIGEAYPEPRFLPAVAAGLSDPDQDVREAARFALNRCRREETTMPPIILQVQTLQNFPIFGSLGIKELRAVASIADHVVKPRGTSLAKRGEPISGVHLVVSGNVEAKDKDGRTTQTFGASDVFGFLNIFSQEPADGDYFVASDAEIFVVNRTQFLEIMKLYPMIGINLCRYLSGLLQDSKAS